MPTLEGPCTSQPGFPVYTSPPGARGTWMQPCFSGPVPGAAVQCPGVFLGTRAASTAFPSFSTLPGPGAGLRWPWTRVL